MPDTHGVAGTSGLGQSVAAAVSRTGHLQILFLMFLVRNIFYDCCCCCPPMCGTTSILPLPHPFYPSLTSLSSLSLSLSLSLSIYLSFYLCLIPLSFSHLFLLLSHSLSLYRIYSLYFSPSLSLSFVSLSHSQIIFLILSLCQDRLNHSSLITYLIINWKATYVC